MSISVTGSYNVTQHYTENNAQRQSTSADALSSGKSLPNDDTVSLSERARGSSQTTPDGMPMMQFNYFGGPPTMVAPQGAGAVEEYAYRRMGMSVDTYSVPHRFADTGAPLDFETWLQREKEIDKVVEQRVDIFNQSKAAGLSDDEILDKLKQFDATLPEDMTKTLGEPYDKDYKVEYDISPQYLAANLDRSREQAFKAMAQSYL